MQEIADRFGIKQSSAYAIVRALREKKYLARVMARAGACCLDRCGKPK